MKGNILVEQVNKEGNIVIDYDTSISVKQIYEKIRKYFFNIHKEDGMIVGNYKGIKYSIRAKNVTYLGNPHATFKKRIQIPNDLQEFYKKSLEKNYRPLLMGVYTYMDNTMFCEFRIEDFITKKAHNSSAHVYSDDIAMAVKEDFFQKIDAFNNQVTVFKPNVVENFLEDLFNSNQVEEINKQVSSEVTCNNMPSELINLFEDFINKEHKIWNGIDCYTAMIKDDYKNKYQSEWAGFYLEYEFEKYINKNALQKLVRYAQNKKEGGIDLDLYFPTIEQYGDLKAHSDYSRGIQGNDWNTVYNLLNRGEHIYYIICEHSTERDSEHDYVVTKFWNTVRNKCNLLSYAKRMKYSVKLKKMYILDINKDNCLYLSKFKQGINSNGKPREPKIMIDKDNIKYFLVKEIIL